jgi:hypothetical protein
MTGYLLVIFSLEVLIFFGIAIRILLIGQRPFLFNTRWVLGVLVLGLSPLPVVLIPLGALSDATGGIIVLLILLLYVAIFLFAAIQTKGYYAMGVTEDSFRTAIHAALQELEIPFEETLTHIKLTSLELDLQVSVHSWMGTAQLRVKPSKGKSVLKEITKAIVNYYQTHETKMNNTAAIFYFVMGLFALAFAITLATLR